ncbi:exodeoxyribonuclease III [Acetobacteraceae bacterium H6797]|nr:exodeoxyribonuclease III [Acetobacteraceae bacterium H6797]
MGPSMLRICTWNINSVRLRLPLLGDLVREMNPDVICLQETKCPDEFFPHEGIEALGYPNRAIRGMKGYNGVAILSRVPFRELTEGPDWCGKGDCRHVGVALEAPGGEIELHDFYIPAGGDIPDRDLNVKFAHKLDFLAEVTAWNAGHRADRRAVLVGDLNIAPLEHDVWSHKQLLKIVSHTPIECQTLLNWQKVGGWVDAIRYLEPEPTKVYTWWSYRARDWEAADKGRRLDHVWITPDLVPNLKGYRILKPARGWTQASDHVPVMIEMEF